MAKKSKKLRRAKRLTCPHCGHTWLYTGQRDLYCSCPICHYNVNIKKARKLFLGAKKG